MGILQPLGLLLGLLAIPIIIFYMLRLRRQEITVSSSMLWRQVVQDRQANSPWQRLRRNLLLYVQLLILALLVLALARPFIEGAGGPSGNVVLILDGSASMQATDGNDVGLGQTRFARAQAEAGRIVDGLAAGARMTIILAGTTPTTVLSNGEDRATLHGAIGGLRPGNGPGNMAAAITLAAAAATAPNTTLVVISDGAIGDTRLPDVQATVRYIPVGHSDQNTAITAMAIRDAPQGPQLFLSLANAGGQATSGVLTVNIDGRLWDSRQVSLGARAGADLTLPDLPLDTRLVTATLSIADSLAVDNTAWAARAAPAGATTLLVSAGNSFMEKALNLLPQVKLSRVLPANYKPGAGFNLTVFDGYMPAALPPGSLLLIDPPSSPLLPISGTIAAPIIGPVEGSDPLLSYVNWGNIHLAEARRVVLPPWARTLVRTTAGDPLLLVGEPEGRRVAVLTFDLHRTDLALQVAFPILVNNLVSWLAPGSALELPPRLAPGSALALHPLPEADKVTVATPPSPDGTARQIALNAAPGLSFGDTGTLGLYQVRQTAKGQSVGTPEWFAINLLDPQEADIAPRPTINLQGQPIAGSTSTPGPREIAPWVLALGTLILALEWWLYHHGSGSLRRLRRT